MYYPLFLDLRHVRCLIVGAGGVGQRKAGAVLEAGPLELLVLDPALPLDAWATWRGHPALRLERRAFAAADLDGRQLVFACTPDRAENSRIAALCAPRGIWCNVADAPQEGNCHVPACARSGGMTAALSTGGDSPAWARVVREELEGWLAPRAAMGTLLGRLRPHVLALGQDTVQNTELFRTLARSPLPTLLGAGDKAGCEALLRRLLPESLHTIIAEMLHELV